MEQIIKALPLVLALCVSLPADLALLAGNMQPADDSNLSADQKGKYRHDSNRLALRDMLRGSEGAASQVQIRKNLAEAYYHGLIHIHNATHLAASRTVVAYGIHTAAWPAMQRLLISLHPETPWLLRWRMGRLATGNPDIDGVLEDNGFVLRELYEMEEGDYIAVLEAAQPLNLFPVAERLEQNKYILKTELSGGPEGGNNITGLRGPESFEYAFTLAWPDIQGGYTNRHYFVFAVKLDGSVKVISQGGDPLSAFAGVMDASW